MYSLSLAHQRGTGVREDFEAAVRWARRTARAGESEALDHLGVSLRYGKGVERDEWARRAERWEIEVPAP